MRENKIINKEGEVVKAGCVVVNDFNQVLLVNEHGDDWGLPKGHAEPGERPEETAVRETLEETGYQVEIQRFLDDVGYTSSHTGEEVCVRYFLARPVRCQVESDARMAWMDAHVVGQVARPNLTEFFLGLSDIDMAH